MSVVLDQAEVEAAWVTIPNGQFVYGAPYSQPCRGKYSEEQVEVAITHSFKMASTELTRREWRMTGFRDPTSSLVSKCDDCPQGFVNWYDITAWLNALSRAVGLPECYDLSDCEGTPSSGCPEEELYRDGCIYNYETQEYVAGLYMCNNLHLHRYPSRIDCPGYRLPTAAEWEWAARGGTTTATYNGDFAKDTAPCEVDPVMEPIGWYCGNHGIDSLEPKPVALLRANAYGLYDMLGNSFEWVDDVSTGAGLLEKNGGTPPLVDPIGAPDDTESQDRTLKGGGIALKSCRCAASNDHPGWRGLDRLVIFGFRPVRTIMD